MSERDPEDILKRTREAEVAAAYGSVGGVSTMVASTEMADSAAEIFSDEFFFAVGAGTIALSGAIAVTALATRFLVHLTKRLS